MTHTGIRTRAYPILSRIKGWKKVITMLASLKSYQSSDIAPERMRMIRFYKQYGEEATKEAFGADRKVINVPNGYPRL